MATRVHLADDLTMFREALAALLATRRGGIEVVGQSSTGEEAIALIKENKPDVVITEVDTQLRESDKILSEVRAASPTSRIIVLTMLDNLHYLKALSKLGVSAYLHKSSSSRELLGCHRRHKPRLRWTGRGGVYTEGHARAARGRAH